MYYTKFGGGEKIILDILSYFFKDAKCILVVLAIMRSAAID
jgi:hypothetical protein